MNDIDFFLCPDDITIWPQDEAIDKARASDERRRSGCSLSILDGIPISVKANLAVATERLTVGRERLGAMEKEKSLGCGYNADTIKVLLRDCGALLVGTTNTDEFGMENSQEIQYNI